MYMDNFIKEKVDLVTFNLGFLPGSDKKICTNSYTTTNAIKKAYELLNKNGMIILTAYSRHPGGLKEANDIDMFLENSDYDYEKKRFDYEIVYLIKKDANL